MEDNIEKDLGDNNTIPAARLNIIRNSTGDYICPICKVEHLTDTDAKKCLFGHNLAKKEQVTTAVSTNSTEKLEEYRKMLENKDTLSAASKLVLSQVEDYLICREREMASRGYPGPMSMQLAKQAAESIIALNKTVVGDKTVQANLNIDAKSNEMDAIKNLLLNRKKGESDDSKL